MAWKAVDGTVKDVRSSTHFGKGGLCAVSFVYTVDGHAYRGEFDVATGRPYAKGDPLMVRYNPAKPEENDLNQTGLRTALYSVTFGLACVALYLYLFFFFPGHHRF
jgi:hypothetical protein